jgi:hypothetical protein
MAKSKLTIFSWGYWGWGTATDRFIQAVDAVERSRNQAAPLFVDVRWARQVRAPGFRENTFEKTVGNSRYRWIRDLGNRAIEEGGGLKIARPAAANELLDHALNAQKQSRRVLFFCACEWPTNCHRAEVARLLDAAARKRGVEVEVVEWPGGEPTQTDLHVSQETMKKIVGGQMSVPLPASFEQAKWAALPWCSAVFLHSGSDTAECLCGPARYKKKMGWYLPVLSSTAGEIDPAMRSKRINELRAEGGFEPMRSRI